jgi:hypothetical protein
MAMALQTTTPTSYTRGYAGMVDASIPATQFVTGRNDDSVSIPFGKAVVWDPSAPATDFSVTLPANQSDPVMGIVVHSNKYQVAWTDKDGTVHGELDGTGLVPGVMMTILRKGRILVTANSNVTAGVSRLYVRRAGGTLGNLEGAVDATNMIDCTTQGQWMETVTSGNLAWLEVDFTNK